MGKHSRGRVHSWEEPSMVASVYIGYLDQIMRDRYREEVNGVSGPKP
jgi:hypothetical protein